MNPSISHRFFRLMLRLYPRDFQDRFGAEMEGAFSATLDLQRARRGSLATPYVRSSEHIPPGPGYALASPMWTSSG